MSLLQAKNHYAGFFDLILIIITNAERTFPWERMPQNQELFSFRSLAESWHCLKLAVFIIATSGEPPDIA
jgi:hypothetical protein